MASGSRDDLPPLTDDVLVVADALRRGLDRILGDAGASLFLYGAAAFPRPAGWRIDFDFHVLVVRSLTDHDRRAIRDLYAELGAASPLGADLDGYFVLVADASRAEPPRHQLDLGIRDHAWALHRAHVRAGRYFLIAGLDPREIVPEPTWAELETGLRHELEFVEAHPAATAFGILNAARVLCSFEIRDVVLSKYQAGQWALGSLPLEWHEAIAAASRWYARSASEADLATLETHWAQFLAFVKRSIGNGS